LFVVTREHNSIASFAIDQTTGRLSEAHRVPTEPDVRPLCLDPSGRFMTAAGSGGTAGRLVTYEVSAATGKMTPLEAYDAGNGPMWILMMRGPGSASRQRLGSNADLTTDWRESHRTASRKPDVLLDSG
jgi:6-phosphogluconolactonase (cycloisomerase 2 family)